MDRELEDYMVKDADALLHAAKIFCFHYFVVQFMVPIVILSQCLLLGNVPIVVVSIPFSSIVCS